MQNMNADDMSTKMQDMLTTIKQVNAQFKNAVSKIFYFRKMWNSCVKVFLSSLVCQILIVNKMSVICFLQLAENGSSFDICGILY